MRADGAAAEENVARALSRLIGNKLPVFVCIGTDAVSGDSLGPLVGTVLENALNGKTYVFGTLGCPVTALDVNGTADFIKKVYPCCAVVAVDAALGKKEEVGTIKIADAPIKPGLGVNKNLKEIGNVSVIGVVEEKGGLGVNLGTVRLSLVYRLAEAIAGGAALYVERLKRAEIPSPAFKMSDLFLKADSLK